jgi:hypothetical protein
MKQKPSSRRRRSSTKSVLRSPHLEHARAAVLNSLNSTDAKRGYRHAIDELVDWYVQSLAWLSTGSWSCVIALISNPVNSPPEPLICVLAPCAGSHTKPPIVVFSALIWRPVFVALKA